VTIVRRPQPRRERFEHSVPMALGARRRAPRITLRPAWVLAALALVALAIAMLWFAFDARFYVSRAQVRGAARVDEAAILAASGLNRTHILAVNRRAAAKQIVERIPSLKQARVSCGLPADCEIEVVERDPLLTWETASGLLWVDAAGGAFPAREPLDEGWRVSGPLPTDEQGLVDRDVLLGLVELTRLGILPGRISFRPGRGMVMEDAAGWRVVLGQGTGMEQRLRVYAAVRAHLLAEGIQPRFVDVRFPQAPYYSETNEW